MEVEKEIVELKKRLHIVQIAFDPFPTQIHDGAAMFVNHGIWTEEFNQMGPREQGG
jgi:hypothetical protein